MEYTIVDTNALKVKLILILFALGFIYALIYLFLVSKIGYKMTSSKQKDVLIRRSIFFTGFVSLFLAELSFIVDYFISSWRARMNEEDLSTIVSSIKSFLLTVTLISMLVYILTFWLCAKFLRRFVGYKPWTVFVSNGKKFGLF